MTDETTTTETETTTETTTGPDYSFLPPELVKEGAIDIDALKTHYAGLAPRAADVPADAGAYAIEGLPDTVDLEGLKASPLFTTLAASAHKQGIGQAAFNETIKTYVEAETKRADETADAEKAKLGSNAEQRIAAVGTFLSGKLSTEHAAALQAMTTNAAAVEALEALMGSAPPPRTPAPTAAAGDTEEDIKKLQSSPEYYDRHKRDPAVVARVDKFYRERAEAKAKAV